MRFVVGRYFPSNYLFWLCFWFSFVWFGSVRIVSFRFGSIQLSFECVTHYALSPKAKSNEYLSNATEVCVYFTFLIIIHCMLPRLSFMCVCISQIGIFIVWHWSWFSIFIFVVLRLFMLPRLNALFHHAIFGVYAKSHVRSVTFKRQRKCGNISFWHVSFVSQTEWASEQTTERERERKSGCVVCIYICSWCACVF